MQKIDSLLLKYIQKLSDGIQVWIGLNNFALAKIILTVAFIFYTQGFILWVHAHSFTPFIIVGILIGGYFYFRLLFYINVGEKSSSNTDILPILTIILRPMRIISLFAIILNFAALVVRFKFFTVFEYIPTAVILLLCAFILETASLYFASCVPKPKQPSILRELFKKKTLKVA